MRMAACAGLARDLARVKKPPRWLRGTNNGCDKCGLFGHYFLLVNPWEKPSR